MSRYLSYRDGGKTDEQGISRAWGKAFTGNVFTGLAVTQQGSPAMGIAIASGDVMIDSNNGYPYLGWSDASENVTLSAADGSNPRYDMIVAYIDLSVVSSASPNNPNALKFTKATGTPAGSPTEPNAAAIQSAVGAGNPYAVLARVTVGAGVTTITNSNITDRRTFVSTNVSQSTGGGWNALNYTPSTVTALGNRSYSLVFTGVDLTSTLTKGMRLRTTRTVAAPTQCTSLNGTTQYYNKTSPNKMTFTDDFVSGAWIKLDSYADMAIISRYNGTSGWWLYVNASGQVGVQAYNASASNYSLVQSTQSIPLNKWVHVSVQLDMSSFTATNTTSYVMVDGINVPASVARAGTNPTTLVQAGNLEVGSRNGGLLPLDGKIAQAFVFSAKVTQANILAMMHQGIVGTETDLASAYSFNNSINDLNTTTPNNLTAQGSAVSTNADSPFGNLGVSSTLDYGVVTAASYSTDTTVTVQVPEGCTIPTSGGVSSVYYSSQGTPFGLPKQKSRWRVTSILRTDSSTTSNATFGSFLSGGWALTVPIGSWDVGWKGAAYNANVANVFFNMWSSTLAGLSETQATDVSPYGIFMLTNAGYVDSVYLVQPQELTSQSTFVMQSKGATTIAQIKGTISGAEIFAEFTYI